MRKSVFAQLAWVAVQATLGRVRVAGCLPLPGLPPDMRRGLASSSAFRRPIRGQQPRASIQGVAPRDSERARAGRKRRDCGSLSFHLRGEALAD